MIADRRTKIVGTIGPASSSPQMLLQLIQAGLNVARLNFSHGTHADHLSVIQNLRRISKEQDAPITLLQDLQGPKIRIGKVQNGSIDLIEGSRVIVVVGNGIGDAKKL